MNGKKERTKQEKTEDRLFAGGIAVGKQKQVDQIGIMKEREKQLSKALSQKQLEVEQLKAMCNLWKEKALRLEGYDV